MAKQCPFWVIAGLIPNLNKSKVLFEPSINDAVNWSTFQPIFLCKGEECQLWDQERKDCGLKQSTPDITMSDVYLAIRNIPEQLENILDKRDENAQDANRIFDDISSKPK